MTDRELGPPTRRYDETFSAVPVVKEIFRQAPGAYLIDGMLFFRLLDGSTISCGCIAQPFADKIVELFNRKDKP